MASATKTPPMIAPGILCPKCKGQMTDERKNKRSDKSPDYVCANVLCTDPTGKYRTAIWAEKDAGGNGALPTQAAPAGVAETVALHHAVEKQKLTKLYLDATEFVLGQIVPKFEEKEIGMSDTAVVAAIATLFIAASKER